MNQFDESFFERADEHINLSNLQLKSVSKGKVSASMMYSVSRFNSWLSASGFNNADEMKKAKKETLDYFVNEYRNMLEENLEDYINNFDQYMKLTNKEINQ